MLKRTLIAALVSLLTAGAFAADINLIPNGTLKGKNAAPDGWFFIAKAKGTCKYFQKGGHNNLPYVEFVTGEKEPSFRCNPRLEAGKSYKLVFWTKSAGKAGTRAAIVIDYGWNKGVGNYKLPADTKGQWVKQEVELKNLFASPKGYQLVFYASRLEGAGTMAVSDITLTQVTAAK